MLALINKENNFCHQFYCFQHGLWKKLKLTFCISQQKVQRPWLSFWPKIMKLKKIHKIYKSSYTACLTECKPNCI